MNETDYCDLDPTKVCDNCCRCLDMDKEFNQVDIGLADRVEDLDGVLFPFDLEEELAAPDADEPVFDPSHVPPLEIDLSLIAEWEARLRAYEALRRRAYMRTLRGWRKKRGK